MHILILGAGGVGSAAARIASRRPFFDRMTIADYDPARPETLIRAIGDARYTAAQVDASNEDSVVELIRASGATHVLNAVDPRFVMPIFNACKTAGVTYLDMAMSLSVRHAEEPFTKTNIKLGDDQFAVADQWEQDGQLALVGMGVEPGLSDVLARYAADELFSEIEELSVRDGANLTVEGYEFAPSFSIWTTIEECLNPPVLFDKDKGGWFAAEPFSDPITFEFPEGIGEVECVNVEHEEVTLMPRWIDAKRVDFKYGLGNEFIEVLRTLHKLGLDSTEPVTVRGQQVSPRDVVAACLPDPATLGPLMKGKTCAGVLVTGTRKDGTKGSLYLYHVVDNEETMKRDDSQAVVWQTAINPVVALELLANGTWKGAGVLGPEAFDAKPFLELLAAEEPAGYGSAWGIVEK
ncbi:saccharopine dehydrogenase NADP-binding domain-containing protein [Arthrobacter jiangjiafuii]|uniref:Saccharopine dehydrogenase NADP-binding domain-containing protein n=1 Tax=Arthrobacter jiangjiafuii TaxID=2817475 RepID=A0A975M814_9MICC|nr:saccharopine dehydrogenase C-terminal domain-containing protein [Arthrobacter jiangjiafuii]MBP3044451.1 saccharopine dehydrogenase NADP-binding domain-containing protein [Arthrobacter jiangjiafuii]QWC11394.1 saccharopine dehydrogenase NADP-binding domain-containing protein [Arthrobacter jiangjiafuii]